MFSGELGGAKFAGGNIHVGESDQRAGGRTADGDQKVVLLGLENLQVGGGAGRDYAHHVPAHQFFPGAGLFELVAHGDRSGDTMAVAFSNEIGSHQSSLGLFRTDDAYTGMFGYALRLTGLEPGINDNARERAIVVHGASYVSRDAVAQWGRIGTTWGCDGLPEEVAPQVIDEIAGGSAIFAYYPDETWLQSSHYLHCGTPGAAGSEPISAGDPIVVSAAPAR